MYRKREGETDEQTYGREDTTDTDLDSGETETKDSTRESTE